MSSGRRDIVKAVEATLAAHTPRDLREQQSLNYVIRAFADLDRPLDEFANPTHATASAIVVGPRGILLHLHKRLNRWLQPGGHVEFGELPHDAAVREVAEETGIEAGFPGDPVLLHVDVHDAALGHHHLDLRYLLVADDVEPAPPENESQQVRWFGFEELIPFVDDGLRSAVMAAREFRLRQS